MWSCVSRAGSRSTSRGQELERDRLAELQVVGAVDLAHAAAAEQADDAIAAAEDRARREAPVVDRARRRKPTGSTRSMTSCGNPSNRGPGIGDPATRSSSATGSIPRPERGASRRPCRACSPKGRAALRADVAGLLRDDHRRARRAGKDVRHALWGSNYMTSRLLYFGKRPDGPTGDSQPIAVPAA